MKGLVAHYIVSMKKVEKQIRKEKQEKLQQEFEDIQNLTFEETVAYFQFSNNYKTILNID